MTVRVHGRNVPLSDELKALAEEKVGRAARFFDGGGDVDVEFSESPNPRQTDARYEVEITGRAAGHVVRVAVAAFDVRAALDAATEKYGRQLRRLKQRLVDRNRLRGADKGLNAGREAVEEERDRGTAIVRTKRFAMKPMTSEEAALQMEMLGHDFFFFLDADSGKHCVLYHRRDGDLGLIEPE